jgi:hypothetical protein
MWPCPIGFYPAVSLFLQDYPEFLQAFFSPLVSQLSSTQPQFEDSELHKLRHAVLEVLAKLPTNDKLQPYLPQLMQVRTVSRGTPPPLSGVVGCSWIVGRAFDNSLGAAWYTIATQQPEDEWCERSAGLLDELTAQQQLQGCATACVQHNSSSPPAAPKM